MRALMHRVVLHDEFPKKNREKMARSLGVNDPSLVSQRGGRPERLVEDHAQRSARLRSTSMWPPT